MQMAIEFVIDVNSLQSIQEYSFLRSLVVGMDMEEKRSWELVKRQMNFTFFQERKSHRKRWMDDSLLNSQLSPSRKKVLLEVQSLLKQGWWI